jgi:hypothetical protein
MHMDTKRPRDQIVDLIPIGEFIALHVVRPTDAQARPDYKVLMGRTENRTESYLKVSKMESIDAPDSEIEFERVFVPREEMIYTGDVSSDAMRVDDFDLDQLIQSLLHLKEQQALETKEWEDQRKEKQRLRSKRRKRKRERSERKETPVQIQDPRVQAFKALVAEPREAAPRRNGNSKTSHTVLRDNPA